jgi:hypothetical protein
MRRVLLAIAMVAVSAAACRVPDTPIDDKELFAALEPPLETGRTTREDALLRFGMPVERFEGDRILCWRISWRGNIGQPVSTFVSPWYGSGASAAFINAKVDPRVRIEPDALVSLVLVFDEGGVLKKARALRQPNG